MNGSGQSKCYLVLNGASIQLSPRSIAIVIDALAYECYRHNRQEMSPVELSQFFSNVSAMERRYQQEQVEAEADAQRQVALDAYERDEATGKAMASAVLGKEEG